MLYILDTEALRIEISFVETSGNLILSFVPYARHSAPQNNYFNAILPLVPNANATQPAIKQVPPSGVTGPMNLNLCGSSTNK